MTKAEFKERIKGLALEVIKDRKTAEIAAVEYDELTKFPELKEPEIDAIVDMATNESFDSLVKKVDKSKGYTKKEAEKVAGSIAAKKRAGAGKGPTAKQKKRMAETILKELRG